MAELVPFVSEKWFKRWLWTAPCRRTRQIVAFDIGDRSETTAQKLWQAIPEGYRTCPVFTDLFNVYPLIVPPEQHHPVPKEAGQTNHQERWYNTRRQGEQRGILASGEAPRIIRRVSLRVSKKLKASINEG